MELRNGPSKAAEICETAVQHGQDLLFQGFTVGQVVHDYGDVCQSITDLAVETSAPIGPEDFRTLNRCLDDAIAGAVTEYRPRTRPPPATGTRRNCAICRQRDRRVRGASNGKCWLGGSTGGVVHRSLMAIRAFADRSPGGGGIS